jgi:beta-galactosidase
MNFGEEGVTKLLLCGRSNHEGDSINIRFSSESDNQKQIVEFPYSKEYVELEFALQKVTGLQRVSFEFLPGTDFDFKWFQFVR